jgi:hypothetical protein
MKKKTSREELERLVMAEIAASGKCPAGIKIIIVRSEEGGWDRQGAASGWTGNRRYLLEKGLVDCGSVANRFRVGGIATN